VPTSEWACQRSDRDTPIGTDDLLIAVGSHVLVVSATRKSSLVAICRLFYAKEIKET
jgi:hypothetical protein